MHPNLKGADRLGRPEKGTNSNFRFPSVQTERNSWSPYEESLPNWYQREGRRYWGMYRGTEGEGDAPNSSVCWFYRIRAAQSAVRSPDDALRDLINFAPLSGLSYLAI